MARNYEEDELDSEERSWLAEKERAAARRAQAHSMAGMPAISEKDYDEQRRQQMLRDQEAIRASQITPGSLTGGDPFNIDTSVSLPGPSENSSQPTAKPPTAADVAATPPTENSAEAVFWTCRIKNENGEEALYGASWEELKARLLNHPGLWTATEHRFANNPLALLGFFVPKQYVFPDTKTKQFEIIVKDGKVFKAET